MLLPLVTDLIDEFVEAKSAVLAPVAGLLGAAEGHVDIRIAAVDRVSRRVTDG